MDHSWDIDLISLIFWQVDANRILQNLIAPGRDDCVAWYCNRSGMFSMKSAYHGQWKRKFATRMYNLQGNGASDLQVWNKVWKLQVLRKIKIFGWRALKGLLPCCAILARMEDTFRRILDAEY